MALASKAVLLTPLEADTWLCMNVP